MILEPRDANRARVATTRPTSTRSARREESITLGYPIGTSPPFFATDVDIPPAIRPAVVTYDPAQVDPSNINGAAPSNINGEQYLVSHRPPR